VVTDESESVVQIEAVYQEPTEAEETPAEATRADESAGSADEAAGQE
jgi:hypothetical protein